MLHINVEKEEEKPTEKRKKKHLNLFDDCTTSRTKRNVMKSHTRKIKTNMKRERKRMKLFFNFISIRRKVKSENYDKNRLNQIMSFLQTSRTAVCTSFEIVIITYTRRCFSSRCAWVLLDFFRGLVEFSATAKKATWECYVVIKEYVALDSPYMHPSRHTGKFLL